MATMTSAMLQASRVGTVYKVEAFQMACKTDWVRVRKQRNSNRIIFIPARPGDSTARFNAVIDKIQAGRAKGNVAWPHFKSQTRGRVRWLTYM